MHLPRLGLSALPLVLLAVPAAAQPAAPEATPAAAEGEAPVEPPAAESPSADATAKAQGTAKAPSAAAEPAAPAEADDEPTDRGAPEPAAAEESAGEDAVAAPVAALPADVEARTEEAAKATKLDAPADKPSLGPLEISTSTWSRLEVREGYDTLGVSRGRFTEGDQVVFRARLGLRTATLALGDGLGGRVMFAPQAAGSWGTSGTYGTVGAAAAGIYQGYFELTSERLDVKGGRFAMSYGEAFTVGDLDWNQNGRAFDGLHAHYKMKHGYVDAFATSTAEGHPIQDDTFLAGDRWFWGVYAGFGGYLAEGLDLDAYFLGLSDPSTESADNQFTRDGATRFTLGARAKQALGALDYRAEGGFQFGETTGPVDPSVGHVPVIADVSAVPVLAYAVEGELGLTLAGFRLGLGGSVASGEDGDGAQSEAYDELYPTTHKWHGLMDVIGTRSNVGRGFVKLRAPLTKSLTALVDGHLFARMEDGGLGRTGADSFAGGEVDAQLVQKFGKWASVRGLYGVFLPNGGHYATDAAAHYGELQGGIDF
jgi:hypothetical protein